MSETNTTNKYTERRFYKRHPETNETYLSGIVAYGDINFEIDMYGNERPIVEPYRGSLKVFYDHNAQETFYADGFVTRKYYHEKGFHTIKSIIKTNGDCTFYDPEGFVVSSGRECTWSEDGDDDRIFKRFNDGKNLDKRAQHYNDQIAVNLSKDQYKEEKRKPETLGTLANNISDNLINKLYELTKSKQFDPPKNITLYSRNSLKVFIMEMLEPAPYDAYSIDEKVLDKEYVKYCDENSLSIDRKRNWIETLRSMTEYGFNTKVTIWEGKCFGSHGLGNHIYGIRWKDRSDPNDVSDEDTFEKFVRECMIPDDGSSLFSAAEVLLNYINYCNEYGFECKLPAGTKEMIEAITKVPGFEHIRPRIIANQVQSPIYFSGARLK